MVSRKCEFWSYISLKKTLDSSRERRQLLYYDRLLDFTIWKSFEQKRRVRGAMSKDKHQENETNSHLKFFKL